MILISPTQFAQVSGSFLSFQRLSASSSYAARLPSTVDCLGHGSNLKHVPIATCVIILTKMRVRMTLLKTGVIATSKKENEQRVAIHPSHFDRINDSLRPMLVFERGYGEDFGFSDETIVGKGLQIADRQEIFDSCDVVILPKPVQADFESMRPGTTLWGWPHCVQQQAYTQTSIDRRLTLIAFEAMFVWGREAQRGMHTFYKNNELAGYCAVLHALKLAGLDGNYGPRLKVAIIGFGSVSRGAAYALQGRSINNMTFYTQRAPHLVKDQLYGAWYLQMRRAEVGEPGMMVEDVEGRIRPFVEDLAEMDIIVNGTLQDTEDPLMFVTEHELARLKARSLIIDVSCDEAMGFPFAQPTSFEKPMFRVEEIDYYAVDHTPTYLWNAASWEVSESLLPYLPTVMKGPRAWKDNETITRSIEIQNGVIQNPKILSFQKRSAEYPHPVL